MVENENQTTQNTAATNPGEVISPREGSSVQPGISGEKAYDQIAQPPAQTWPQVEQTFAYNQDDTQGDEASQDGGEGVRWVASEFIFHEKTQNWYFSLAGVAVVVVILMYLITHSLLSVGVIIFGSVIFGVYASRRPRQLSYQVDAVGVQVGDNLFHYNEFNGFSILQEGSFSSIAFTPLKRFSPLLSIYYPPEYEEEIVATISAHLPIESREQDALDKLMHRIGF